MSELTLDKKLTTDSKKERADVDIIAPPRRIIASIQDVNVSLLRENDRDMWDTYAKCHKNGTIFHTTAWRDAVARTFGHRAYYLIARSNEKVVGILPVFRVVSRLFGRIMVSVPYGVGGGVLAEDENIANRLLEELKRVADSEGCNYIDLRSECAMHTELPLIDRYVGFERELPDRAEGVLAWLPRKARAAARNARNKYGLCVDFDDAHLTTTWKLYTQSMRRLASPNYPLRFFRSLADAFARQHWVCLIRRGGRPIAGLVTFLHQDRVMPYFYGATEEARQYDAGNLIYLSVMERAVAAGYRVFDFGRSRSDNDGSVNFKRFCGFEPRPLQYQHWCAPGASPPQTSPTSARYALARRVWPELPLCVTRMLGAVLTKHIPG